MKSIARVTLNTSTSAEYCFGMQLEEFICFHDVLCKESEEMRREAEQGNGKK